MRSYRRFALGAALLSLALVAGACGSGGGGTTTSGGTTTGGATTSGAATSGGASTTGGACDLTVGVSSGGFSESPIMAEIYGQALEHAGCTVSYQLKLADRKVSDQALFSGSIDLKPEYLASESLALDANAKVSGDSANNAKVLATLEAKKGIDVLNYSPAIDTNVFVVTKETADKYHLSKVSDLAAVAGQFVFGAPPDCATNNLCAIGLKKLYGITFKQIRTTDFGGPITVHALKSGAVQVGELFSTSIYDPDFVQLVDDKHLENADNIVPVIRHDKNTPMVAGVINAVSAKVTTEKILELNKEVDIAQKDPADVAKSFLEDNGLMS